MKPTKRQSDPLGRSTAPNRYRLRALCLAVAITGSVWPIQARSIRASFDRQARQLPEKERVQLTELVVEPPVSRDVAPAIEFARRCQSTHAAESQATSVRAAAPVRPSSRAALLPRETLA